MLTAREARNLARSMRRGLRRVPFRCCSNGWMQRLALLGFLSSSVALAQFEGEQHPQRMAEGLELFKQQVRSLFVDKCLACHGGEQTLGGLDLSSRDSLRASGKLGESAESSPLLAVLRHEREPFMPFGQEQLAQPEIETVARWVGLGAPYDKPLIDRPDRESLSQTQTDSQFWSLQPLTETEPPVDASGDWALTLIDRFIEAKLDSSGLQPNPEAGRRTLIRRASLNLLGLPPSSDAVDAFVRDPAPDAYERLVDKLLASPHYGERWARHWMDIARFAESYGFEQDYDRPYSYHYRDFLIKAFNRDMPYVQFVRWQIAGDELQPENPLALMATGFLGAGAFPTEITESEFEIVRYDELDDMIGTIGTAMLGLTVGCARCHDHKHDPVPVQDYYRMAAVFGRTTRTELDYDPTPEADQAARSKWEARRTELRAARLEFERTKLGDGFERWLDRDARDLNTGAWRVLDFKEIEAASKARMDVLDDGSILAGGANVDFDRYTLTADLHMQGVRALRIEALTHPSLPFNGPGRSHDGQFLLAGLEAEAQPIADPEVKLVKLRFRAARATDELDQDASSVAAALDGSGARTGWSIRPESIGTDQAAVLELDEPLGFEGGTRLTIRMRFGYDAHYSLGRIRVSASIAPESRLAVGTGVPQVLAEGLAVLQEQGAGGLSDTEKEALLRQFASVDDTWRSLNKAVREHEERVPIPAVTRVFVTGEGFPIARHNSTGKGYPHFYEQTHILSRGDPSQKTAPAEPGFLRVLMRDGADSSHWVVQPPEDWDRSTFNRASLAHWITDPARGAGALLARVIVNRLWHHHFGAGIVASPSNFGTMGERPTHPELLDWLARDLIENGWRLKRLHRMIMTSAVYRESGAHDEANAVADRANRLRWRWSPRRLEAEAVRDSLLSASGMLDRSLYGRGVLREAMRRRSIYFFIKRSELVPSMTLFDWPEHLVGIGTRPSTTIAPQALMFLNSPEARRYAEAFANRLDELDFGAAIEKAYQIAYSRPPQPSELADGVAFLEDQRSLYATEGRRGSDRLALVDYCQSLLSLNEFLYIR